MRKDEFLTILAKVSDQVGDRDIQAELFTLPKQQICLMGNAASTTRRRGHGGDSYALPPMLAIR